MLAEVGAATPGRENAVVEGCRYRTAPRKITPVAEATIGPIGDNAALIAHAFSALELPIEGP
jgi:hypothetical protein